MTRIIPLKREGAPNGTNAAALPCAGELGQVILFPGVRYERWEERRVGEVARRLEAGAAVRIGRDWLEI